MQPISRPTAAKKKIHSKNEFELCYLRHKYIRKAKFNPSEVQMAPYMGIIINLAKHTFYTYFNLFRLVGFDLEDVISIGKVHLVSFLGLFSLEQMPHKYVEFLQIYDKKNNKSPNDDQILDKNKANLTMFVKQRMEDLVRICRQKGRNIKGLPTDEFYVFYGPFEPPSDSRIILEDYETLGFKKIDIATFKSIKKRQGIKSNRPFKFAGYWYIAVPIDKRNLSMLDFTGAGMDPYDSIHNKTPEELLIMNEKENEFQSKLSIFKGKKESVRMQIVENFINKNKENPIFKDEIQFAMEYLEDLRD